MDFRPRYTGLIDRYRNRLPVSASTRIISLGEGNTPLVRLERLTADLPVGVELYVKFEGLNPTGSFKDRGMTMAVTRALEEGSGAIVCASTGNTSASAAAYAARAGMRAFVLIPDGKIAMGKLAQAIMHGARVVQIQGNFDDGMRLVREVAEQAPVSIVNSINPYRLQGQKTAAFEICEELGGAPDYHYLPVGNAGNITAHWMGYCELSCFVEPSTPGHLTDACTFCDGECRFAADETDTRPRMVGYQAAGANPFLRGEMVDAPETIATAIRIGHPQSWRQAWAASRESGGWFDQADDALILATQRALADHEGIFCEPASAIAVAGALRDVRAGRIPEGSRLVCTLTGHGLKDPDVAIRQAGDSIVTVPAELDPVRRVILDAL